MNLQEYTSAVRRTESPNFYINNVSPRLLHGAIGLVTESGELLDAIKKSVFYGKPLDVANVHEELGDLMYYAFLAIDAIGGDIDSVLTTNRDKLAARYKEKFSAEEALTRDLATERSILDAGVR